MKYVFNILKQSDDGNCEIVSIHRNMEEAYDERDKLSQSDLASIYSVSPEVKI